jgi:hypothetical protein
MSVEAAARNEELFRTVNEQIEAVSQTVPATESNMEFLCECDDVECVEKVSLTRANTSRCGRCRLTSSSFQSM